MILQDLRIRFGELRRANDLAGIAQLLSEHPEMVATPECAASMMHSAAMLGDTALVALLVEHGVDVNIPQGDLMPQRPIGTAATAERDDTVRWLVEHGAEINYEWDGGELYCMPLAGYVLRGNLEMVHLLVEAGAKLNVLDRRMTTPLSIAIRAKHKDIEDYLRSKGALEDHQIPGYVPHHQRESCLNPILYCVRSNFGDPEPESWLPIVPDEVPVAIRVVFDHGVAVIFTEGMSAQPMNVPPGAEWYQYAELVAYLLNWPKDPKAWSEPEYLWPVTWMRRLAQYPFEYHTWLGGRTAVISNGDPPQPLGPGTEMTCWLLLAEREPMTRFQMPDGRSVFFYEMLPIHTAERDYERDCGTAALLQRLEELHLASHLDPKRPSVV
jgi:hypothetical protein